MRIARFAADGDPQYGIVELAADGGSHPDTVSVLTGDPIAMPVQLTGERKELDGVRLLAPVIPRSKVVVSDTYRVPDDNPWHDQTTVIGRSDIGGWLDPARRNGDGDILVFGSRTMWNGLLRQGLVDELHLMVSPKAVGSGTPIVDFAVDLDLLEARGFDGSANVLLRYAVLRAVPD